jgi:hypothetical protein
MSIDINEANVDDLKVLEYTSPKISDKENDKVIIKTFGSFTQAPCKCITVSYASDSFTLAVDQSKLTIDDSGKYFVKVSLEDEQYS